MVNFDNIFDSDLDRYEQMVFDYMTGVICDAFNAERARRENA